MTARATGRDRATAPAAALHGRVVVITRPAGTAAPLARRVRALGGVPLALPGLAVSALPDLAQARASLRDALADDVLIFTSPMAVRFAAALLPLRSAATVIAVGLGSARALRRHGMATPLVPQRQDSEGLLGHPLLQQVRGLRISVIGAAGGRSLLREQLLARGAQVRERHVYRRRAARLDRRHVEAVLRLPDSSCVLLSSVQALRHLAAALPPAAWRQLAAATAVASSARVAEAARAAGFARIVPAASALPDDLLAAAVQAC